MKRIMRIYQSILEKEVSKEDRDSLFRRMDGEAAQRMGEQGFSREQAKEAIFSRSPCAREKGKAEAEKYLDGLLLESMGEGQGIPLSRRGALEKDAAAIYAELRDRYAAEFELLYFTADKKAISSLLDMGFLPREVYDAWQDNSLYAEDLRDGDLAAAYEDRVRREVAEDRESQSLLEMDGAMKSYRQQKEMQAHKFAGSGEEFALYHDGETAIALLAEGFLPETVREVFRQDIRDRDYLEKLREACGKVRLAYLDIREAPSIEAAASVAATYRAFARNYMQRNGMKLLGFSDEEQILQEMREEGFPQEFMKKALLAASPVAREPGREPEQYVDALLSGAPGMGQQERPQTRKAFVQAEDIYKGYINQADKELRQEENSKGVDASASLRTYYDCLATRKLLLAHIPEKDIVKTLQAFSTNRALVENYGYWMVEKAKRILRKEQDLKREPAEKIPDGKSLAELKVLGFDEPAIYRGILQERIDLNPSVEGRLYEKFLDLDMAESCLSRYPDFDRDILHAFAAESPRALLLADTGLVEERKYADGILKEAQRRIEESRGSRQEEKSLIHEFNRQRGLAYQGIAAKSADPAYQFGRSALQLMLMGYELLSIRKAILQGIVPQMGIEQPEAFADGILEKVQEVHARLLAVKEWMPKEPQDAEEAYRNRLHEKYEARKSVRPSMDIEIIRELLLEGRYAKKDILAAVTAHSPMASEPGRDETYVRDYLLPQAESGIASAKDKLRADKPHPREGHAGNIREEYAFQREILKKRHPLLPYSMQMDELAAAALRQMGFSTTEVAKILEQDSPCREEQSHYGISMTARVNRQYMEEHYREETPTETRETSIVRERSLNPSTGQVETATSTTTDTATA